MRITVDGLRASRTGRLEVVPNINRSNRPLPEAPSLDDMRAGVKLDCERTTRRLDDVQLCRVFVADYEADLASHPGAVLEVQFAENLYQLLDQSAKPLKGGRQPLAELHALRTKGQGIQLFIEGLTFTGSWRVADDASPRVVFRLLDGDTVLDEQALFNGAPLVPAGLMLLGDDAPAERLFICDVGDNGPSLAEIKAGAAVAGVPLTVLPLAANLGDSWLQDQCQLAVTITRDQALPLMIHLPRVAHDAALVPGVPNLRSFVDTHFPSHELGVFRDLWSIELVLDDGQQEVKLGVAESYPVFKALVRVVQLLRRLLGSIAARRPDASMRLQPQQANDLVVVRRRIDAAQRLLTGLGGRDEKERSQIEALPAVVNALCDGLRLDANGDVVFILRSMRADTGQVKESRLRFNDSNARALQDFFTQLVQLHSPENYGGNIEVSPPSSDAPEGRILTGSVGSDELRRLLASCAPLQPWSSVYTRWLEVGHIDEIAAFAPRPRGGFAVLRAAPLLALTLLERAAAAQRAGTPVTRLFRGKKWLHEADPQGGAHRPPNAYIRMTAEKGRYDLSALLRKDWPHDSTDRYVDAAFHDDRRFLVYSPRAKAEARYAASIGCEDLLRSCRAANRAIEALFLTANDYTWADDLSFAKYYGDGNWPEYRESIQPFKLEKVLAADFSGVPVIPIPVLFDAAEDLREETVKALMPDLVNLQVLGRDVLVPRPYGPRMHVADAVAFFAAWDERQGGLRDKPSADWLRQRGLDHTWHWTRAAERVTRAAVGDWPTTFDADYDEMVRAEASAVAASTTTFEVLSYYWILHRNDTRRNHPVTEPETLAHIADWFRDGFEEFVNPAVDYAAGDTATAHPKQDQYEAGLQKVMERIRRANPQVFDAAGNVLPRDWVRVSIPEDTVDLFEVYVQSVIEGLGLRVQWVDSWYYHVHAGGIHCGTNVLRSR